jgi:hypothetical protein
VTFIIQITLFVLFFDIGFVYADGFSASRTLSIESPDSKTQVGFTSRVFAVKGLTEKAKSLIGLQSIYHGPNCYNSALVGSGVTESLRYVSNLEFSILIHSPICEQKQKNERLAGDLQVFYRSLEGLDEANSIPHANIWLNEKLDFNKMSLYHVASYELIPHDMVMQKYQYYTDILIFTVQQKDGSFKQIKCPPNTVCENEVQYFRCGSSLSEYIFSLTNRSDIINYFNKFQSLEKDLESVLFIKTDLDKKNILSRHLDLKYKLSQLAPMESEGEFVLKYLNEAMESVTKQLDFIK